MNSSHRVTGAQIDTQSRQCYFRLTNGRVVEFHGIRIGVS